MGRTSLGASYRRLVAASGASNLADGVFLVALPLLTVELTTSPVLVAGVALAQRLPWLVVARGLVGSWVAAPLERVLGRAWVLTASVVAGSAALIVPVVTAGFVPVAASGVVTGVAMVCWNVVTVSLRQRITPDHLLGRLNAGYRLLGWGTMPVGAALGGLVAEFAGLRTAFAVSAVLNATVLLGRFVVTDQAMAEAEAAVDEAA